MSHASHVHLAGMRQCVYCGKPVAIHLTQCPHCREALPGVPVLRRGVVQGGREIRRGLLYMLMAAVIYYFSGGYSGMALPIEVGRAVTAYLVPLLFLGGLGLSLYGFYLRMRS